MISFKKTFFAASLLVSIAATAVHAQSSSLLQSLTGSWQFTAANNGKEVAPGIYSAGKDTVYFVATVADDGQSLNCHADCLYKSTTGQSYPADWSIIVEENAQGQYRLGWVLTTQQPTSSTEFQEDKESYLENGFWYWGTDDAHPHRYIYLLTENEDASAHVATTVWSAWSNAGETAYALSSTAYNSQKLYAIVAADIPYAHSVGYIEIWASPKLQQLGSAGMREVRGDIDKNVDEQKRAGTYDLSGRRLWNTPQRGLYIRNGKKYYHP